MTIVSPMMAQLGVTNASQSLAFYRDVLGFSHTGGYQEGERVLVAEVRLGEAILQVAEHDGVIDSPEQRRARRATILFFACDDVVSLYNAVKTRGGSPSDLSIVHYWIRMKMFEISDPDDHTLWFGQQM